MANFCPICKADCAKECGLYDKEKKCCSILITAQTLYAIGKMLSGAS